MAFLMISNILLSTLFQVWYPLSIALQFRRFPSNMALRTSTESGGKPESSGSAALSVLTMYREVAKCPRKTMGEMVRMVRYGSQREILHFRPGTDTNTT